MKVRALGVKQLDGQLEVQYAENGNYTAEGCKNEIGNCGCTHAEINLLKILPNPTLVVVSHSPCENCAKELIKAKVQKVIYVTKYRIETGINLLESNGVAVVQINKEEPPI